MARLYFYVCKVPTILLCTCYAAMALKEKLKIKSKMTFKQCMLIFSSCGELSTQALEDVIAAIWATIAIIDTSISNSTRITIKKIPPFKHNH